MLYLLYQLADSPDPDEADPEAFAEFQAQQAAARRRPQDDDVDDQDINEHDDHDEPAHDDEENERNRNRKLDGDNGRPTRSHPHSQEYRPTELRDLLKNPREQRESRESRASRVTSADQLHEPKQPNPADPPLKQRHATPEPPPRRDVAIKSRSLAENYTEFDPDEPTLLRDLPYTLQGLSSTTLPFGKNYCLRIPATLPPPLVGLLHTLAEPALLYTQLQDFVQAPPKGLVGQSLAAAIGDQLRSYLTLVATLEGQIRRALATIDQDAPRCGIGKVGVTLKRCVVWTREATMGLRLMSLIAHESKSKKGGQIISLVHSFSSSHGDPVVAAFADRLLNPVTRPFYDILRHWIYDGELSDPYLEYFVQEQTAENNLSNKPKASAASQPGTNNVWEDKYMMDLEMIPSIITPDFAEKVFLIGKSLNFIRHSCGDAQWVESYSKDSSKELRYGDMATLEAWIDDAYKTTMRRLMHLMTHKFHLFDHLQALRDYILLGQGDFIALLMESLAANLDRPAGAQYRHTLTAQLEHAIRGSNAQYDSAEVLRRLDARMLQLSHGDIGWDCFTLEYKIDAPVDVVVSDWGNRQYLKVFNFLWRVKRVEFALSSTWRRVTTGSRGVLQTRRRNVAQAWRHVRGHLAEMVHFVGQLQYYILFEVIESSWTELQKRLRRDDTTLDDVIHAHTKYLESITHKGLLGARRRRFVATSNGTAVADAPEDDDNSYMIQLGELLRIMLSYRDSVDGLYSWSVSDYTRQQEADLNTNAAGRGRRPGAQQRNRLADEDEDDETGNNSDGARNPNAPQSEFPALNERLRHLGDRFRSRLQLLLGDLAYQNDIDLRFLGVSMNFNDVYQPIRRKTSTATASAKSTGAGRDTPASAATDRGR